MFKYIILFFIVTQVLSDEDSVVSISAYPLFTKVLGLIDQVLIQVRRMQSLISRSYNMTDRLPDDLRSYFAECFSTTLNASRSYYSEQLSEVETIRLPQIKDRLKQAANLEEQLNVINITDRILTDVSLNILKPSLSLVTEILDCFKNKSQSTFA